MFLNNDGLYDQCVNESVATIDKFLRYYLPLRGVNVTYIVVEAKYFHLSFELLDSKEIVSTRNLIRLRKPESFEEVCKFIRES